MSTVFMNSTAPIAPDIVASHGLTPKEYARIEEVLGRAPTITELGVFSVMWSEHCSYKHTRKLLATLPTKGPIVLHGPGENAGAIDLGNGLACVFKIESHNHPSAVEPFEGAATGVGGILRDVFAMGARPVALMDSLRFGPPSDSKNKWTVGGVVAGIAHYGNCVGVPVIGGEFSIDPCYSDNCLVNVMAIGLARHDELMTARARSVGQKLLYYGNATGRDGIHGATFASTDLTEETAESRSSVQVGDPFMEKKILEATLELIRAGVFVALQDMGAAGLTCSSTEMASKGGLGLHMNLDAVPQRAAKMTAYELLLSESQERMLGVVAPEDLQRARTILAKWDLDGIVVGETTDTKRFVVEHRGVTECDIPLFVICDEVPWPEPVEQERRLPELVDSAKWLSQAPMIDWADLLLDTMRSPHFSSKRWIYQQYDHQVQTNTVVCPGAGAGVIRVREHGGLLAATVDGNGLWVAANPYEGTKCVVAEAARNLVACGARPLAVTNNLNFGNPRTGVVAWQLRESVRGLGDACRALGTPITGGNVSLYNESPRMAVFPTPVIGMVGIIDDPAHLTPGVFQNEGDAIFILGPAATHVGCSRVLKDQEGVIYGPAPTMNLEQESRSQGAMATLIKENLVTAAADIADGGLMVTLAEMAMGGALGMKVDLPPDEKAGPSLLSEEPSRFVFTTPECNAPAVEQQAARLGVRLVRLGTVAPDLFCVRNVCIVPMAELRAAWECEP